MAYGSGAYSANKRTRSRGALLAALLIGTSIGGAVIGAIQNAVAQSAAQTRFSVPTGPLSRALTVFGRQAGLQVTFLASAASDKSTPGFTGSATPDVALARILQGTGLSYQFTNATTVAISGLSRTDSVAADGSVVLDTINVTAATNAATGAGYQGTPDWVYETPASVSVVSREAIQNSPARNTRDLLDNVAGVYANRSEAQNPGISVNIRGLQDQDRIATMIDGARQNFQRSGHGATQRTYVDTAFVRTIEIEKSSTSGVGSAGSLGGLVNFRTIIADDLIQPGRNWGVELNGTTGTNAFNFDGSAAAAARISDSFSILGGISHKNIGAFKVGKNGDLDLGSTYNGDVMLFSGQEVVSGILKAEAVVADDMKLTLGWIRNNSDFSTGNVDNVIGRGNVLQQKETVVNDTLTAAFSWKPVANDLIDLKARLYYNHLDNDSISTLAAGYVPTSYSFATLGGSIENTSRFFLNSDTLSFNYGAEAFSDTAKTKLASYFFGGEDYSDLLTGANPGGTRDVASGFFNGTWEHNNWLTVRGGLRYDWYGIAGNTTIFDVGQVIHHPGVCRIPHPSGTGCLVWTTRPRDEITPPQPHDIQIDRSEGTLLPTVSVAIKATDWLQPFAKYSKSFRPPTVMESFINGGHVGSSISSFAPNPLLKPERADTWEVGANIAHNGTFKADDSLRLKVVGFYREIEDYITFGSIYHEGITYQGNRIPYQTYVNLDGITRMKGLEIEANYDARSWYLGGSVTRLDTEFATTYTGPNGNSISLESGVGPTVIFVQPKYRVAIDAGVRLFDEKLTLGGRVTHVAPTKPTLGSLLPETTFGMDEYTVYDLYGSYAFNATAKLRFAITNLTDLAYAPAVGAAYYAAPGRTATVSLNLKF